MGNIRTYEQQVGLSNTPSESFARVAAQGDVAKAKSIGTFGEGMADVGIFVHKSNVQKDVSDSHASLSEIRNMFSKRIQDETQKGTLDAEKIQSDYQDAVSKAGEGLSTTEGRSFFEKSGAELGSQLVRSASVAQAQLSGKLAVEQIQNSLNLNGSTLQSDPASFDETLNSSIGAIEAQVTSGNLNRADAEKLKRLTGESLAENAVRGWTNIDADTAKNILASGQFDKYISGDQKKALETMIHTAKGAEETEKLRRDKLKEEAQKKASEAWEQGSLQALNDKSISTKDILNSPLTANRKIQWLNMLKSNLKESLQTDPAVKNEMIRRVLLPDGDPRKIKDPAQLYDKVGNGLTISDLTQITTFMEKTPDGSRLRDNRKRLIEQADATLAGRDPVTGQPDPQGAFNMSLFTNALADEEARLKKEGKDVTTLYDPTSKEYFGHKIFKYKATSQDIMNRSFDFKELDVPENAKSSVRQEGESIADFLKRTGK